MNFNQTLKDHNLTVERGQVEILQINIGRKCNLACSHCHVEAGPLRTENMDEKTLNEAEEVQDEALEKEEEKKKAKHRKRGPYRKAHANW